MNRLWVALILCSMAITTAIGCSTSVTDPDSETHWLKKCTVDSDCEQGLSCLCNTCTRPCGGMDCGGLGARAACVTPTPSGSDACQMAPGVALCTKTCSNDADCSAAGSGLRCIGGACLAGAPRANAGRATSTSTWVADLVDAYCTWGVRCGKFPDGATCYASKGIYFVTEGFNSASAAITAVSNGTAEFDATAATACLTALSQVGCEIDFWTQPSVPAPCTAAFSGHVSDGGTCIDDVECGTGSMCVVASTVTCQGTCTPASGGGCRMDADCPGDQYCAGALWSGPGFWASGSCSPAVPPGANPGDPCGTPVQCATGLHCQGGPAISPVGCATGVPAGSPCGGFNGPGCALGLACVTSDDGTTQTCMPEAKLGDPCTSLFQCGAQFQLSDMICDLTGSHTCVQRPSTGSCVLVEGTNSCDPVVGFCDGTPGAATCRPWLSVGEPCVFPTNGFDPCGHQASCQGSGSTARCTSTVAPVCTPM